MNHVLIVDDEAEIRESLESILREEDYLVTTAATAAEAVELLSDATPEDVIFIAGSLYLAGEARALLATQNP